MRGGLHGRSAVVGHVEPVRLPRRGERVGVRADDDAGPWHSGVVTTWEAQDARATLVVGLDRAGALNGKRVWIHAVGPDRAQQWFNGQGRAAGAEVVVDSPVVAAVETRRASIRAPLPGQATFTGQGGHGRITGGLLDISGTGCRVRVLGSVLPQPGQVVDLTAALTSGLLVRTQCSVAHVHDGSPAEVGLQFEDLPGEARLELERAVLAVVAGESR